MKLSTIITLSAVALVSADNCENVDPDCSDPGSCFVQGGCAMPRFDLTDGLCWDDLNFANVPTIPELNAVYDNFCGVCDLVGILQADQAFCALCDLDFDCDGTAGETTEDLWGFSLCFSGQSTVQTPSGHVSMDMLQEYVELQGGFAIMSYQDFIHMALSPFRLFTMGLSSGNISYTEAGIPAFASAGIDLALWTEQQNILVQAALFAVFFVLAGCSMLLENTFGPTMAPVALVAGAGAWAVSRKMTVRKLKSV
ncbi:expressed unknown protein [Seminavis robusta]|uniref:Uncharacterized protein n=1 Tax=Seminavis robusta TaxID=568900 RepID=A0A9N8HQY6_9STRA|nr:expressed unknown protein [Seminavis robusta]|eukprot:Sro1206_g252370.1 n/a (254) ;mRNA; r:17596-18681